MMRVDGTTAEDARVLQRFDERITTRSRQQRTDPIREET